MDLDRIAAWLLVPAPLFFAIRSILHIAGRDDAWMGAALALGGVLSLAGLGILGVRHADARPWAFVVLIGHFAVSEVAPDLGAGMVYFGTGMLVLRWSDQAAVAGLVALIGAVLRPAEMGHVLVAVGSAWLAWAIVGASRNMTTST